jgi:catechol 2,3-dioxygenase-like lactoylglutathione lyase family enzyme
VRSISSSAIGSPAELKAQGVVEIVVPNLAAARKFCFDLGFRVARETSTFAVVEWGGALLFLAENADAPATERWLNIRIVVPDVDAVWHRATAALLPVQCPIGDRPYGLRDFTLRAPGGFDVRFAQVLASTPPENHQCDRESKLDSR